MTTSHTRGLKRTGTALACLVLAACSGGEGSVQRFITRVEHQPGGRVEPLPTVPKYETFTYDDQNMRSPFVPSEPTGVGAIRPDSSRPRQYLERFPLDTLMMVGTMRLGNVVYGLVQTKDGIVHRVAIGNYMGQNDGRIIQITPTQIRLVEIVPDGLGGFVKRPAALGLSQ
ncbi:MAG: pilus assembly protein PilP [Steroidobacteraceae bacterium]|jgi:type IV pilus assembly protein PilP